MKVRKTFFAHQSHKFTPETREIRGQKKCPVSFCNNDNKKITASQPKRKEQTLIYFDLLSALPAAAAAAAAVLVCHNLIKCHFKNKTGHRNRGRERRRLATL